MDAACPVEYITKGCQCLGDPMLSGKTVCGFVNQQTGFVISCPPGCCQPMCSLTDTVSFKPGTEFRPIFGGELPPGFGALLETSDQETSYSRATDLSQVPQSTTDNWKVWQYFLIGALLLLFILLMARFLG